jgi:hypothetical protein
MFVYGSCYSFGAIVSCHFIPMFRHRNLYVVLNFFGLNFSLLLAFTSTCKRRWNGCFIISPCVVIQTLSFRSFEHVKEQE